MLFDTPVKLNDGRYFVRITNDDKSRVFQQINNCEVVGPGCYKTSIDLSKYDDEIISKATECSETWFGKVIPEESLKNMYESSITSDVFEAGFMKIKGKNITTVFDTTKDTISVDRLVTGVHCNLFVELSGIWFLKKNFGPIWRVAQARLIENVQKPKLAKYMFVDEEPQDEEEDLADFV